MEPQTLRQIFKQLNRFMVLFWRLGLGGWMNAWPEGFGRILVLTHTGRKSGLRRRTPLNYALSGGDVYCVSGFGRGSDWFRNLQANPQVEVWLPEGWWAGEAQLVEDEAVRLPLVRQVLINSGFAAPLFEGVYPARLSEAELAHLARDYQLVRIRRTAAVTGPGAHADLAWVWPAALAGMLGAWLLRRRVSGRRR